MNQNMSVINKIALLSISFILTTAYAISAGIPQMIEQFPEQSKAQIQLLTTVPAAAVMCIVLFTNTITKLIGTKRTVQLGFLIVAIFGPMPMLLDNYYMILACRIMMGVGFGLANSLAVSLISHFFSGTEKATMLGWRNATESIGQSLLILAGGYLIAWGSWRSAFIVYTLAIPILLLVTFFVPDVDKAEQTAEGEIKVNEKKSAINLSVAFYTLGMFIVVASYVGMRVTMPIIFKQGNFGDVAESGQILSIVPFVAMAVGILFGKIYGFFNKKILLIGSLIASLGYMITIFSVSYFTMLLGAIIIGIGYPLIIIGTFTYITTFSPKGAQVFVTSVILFGINLGAFSAPYVLKFVEGVTSMLFGSTTNFSVFGVFVALLITFGVVSFLNLTHLEKKQEISQ